jgi:GT2 family glycosyltransferase
MAASPTAWHSLSRVPAEVAIVIVNYRSADLTIECVAGLPAATGGLEYETVVVDNASGDGSAPRIAAAAPAARIVERASNDGFAAGVNAGFAATEAPVVVVLNPDAQPAPGAVARLVEHLSARPGVGLAAPRLTDGEGVPQASAYRRLPGLVTLFREFCVPLAYALVHVPRLDPYQLPQQAYVSGARAAHVYGACMAIRRAAYEQAGPFDEGFFLYLEETEWQGRLAARGWAIELVPEAEVRHLVRGGGDAALAPSQHYLPSAERYFGELAGRPVWLVRAVMASGALVSWLFLAAVAAVRRDDELSHRKARAWRHVAALTLGR